MGIVKLNRYFVKNHGFTYDNAVRREMIEFTNLEKADI